MKKFYYSLFAAATLLLATSCSQEEDFAQQSSNEVTTFSVSLDGETGARAAGDGTKVNKLYYAVYDQETQNVIYPANAKFGVADKANGGWTLELPLMKSETYDILFWAQVNGSQYYNFTELTDIEVKYDNVLSNIEDRDAFFNALDDFKASGSKHTIVLRRPFAQLNIATTLDDWNAAKAITKTEKPVTKSSVKVSSLATKFNVLTGAATATTPATVEFKANDLIDETISIKLANATDPTDYKLLAMNYLLPVVTKAPNGLKDYNASTLDTDKDVVEVEFTLYKGDNGAEKIVNVKVPSTPVQRNYRTNIIGDLLTGEHFDIIVDADFDKEENQEITISAEGIVKEDGIYYITKPEGLWALANLVNNGSQSATPAARAAAAGYSFKGETFVLDCNVDLEGKEWTPMDGFAGTFDGNKMTISNFKVNKAESAGLFGNLGTGATIKNLTVTNATIHSNHWAGAIAGRGLCVKFINCAVENSTVTVSTELVNDKWDNGDKAGAIIGYISGEPNALVEGCSAKDVTIQAYRDLGGIVGYASGYANGPAVIKNNKAENIVLVIDNAHNYKNYQTQGEHDAGIVLGEKGANAQAEGNTDSDDAVTIIYTEATEYPGYYEDAEGNYCVTEDDGIETVLKDDKFWEDKTEVSVILKSNLTVDVTAWDGDKNPQVFGKSETETITIDLQGNTLTFNQLGSDWNNIAANNAKLIIKNGHITSSGHNDGPWNRHDLNFACKVELIDITTDKAIALKNAGTLTNVTISDANTSDTYALWIQPNGQTVTLDGCTIDMIDCTDGRGIKIDEQYVDAPALVTLNVSNTTFKTEEKSAILVKSAAGADITLNNIDITHVQADKVCAVWVDEASAASFDMVNVTGGKKALEGAGYYTDANGDKIVTEDKGITNLIKEGYTNITLSDGNYTIPDEAKGKTLTFIGSGRPEDVTINSQDDGAAEGDCDYSLEGATATFNNVTITTTATYFPGYVRMKGTYNNCIINGVYTLYDNSTFTNCTFNISGDFYNVWTWGATEATFNKCTFNSDGKAVLLYGQVNTKLTINECVFNDNGGLSDKKAAIEIGNDYNKSYELIVNKTTVNGYEINDKGINTGTTLFGNKNSMSNEILKVVVDGMTFVSEGVWMSENVYYISSVNGLKYSNENLFSNGGSYKLTQSIDMTDVEWTSKVPLTKHFTFDGGNNTISNWKTSSSALLVPQSNYNIEIKNLELTNCVVNTTSNYAALLIGYADSNKKVDISGIKVNQSEVTGNDYCAALLGWSSMNANISGCSVKNSKFTGGGSTGAYAGHVVAGANGVVTISDAVVEGCNITTNDDNKSKAGIVLGTANIGTTSITTSLLKDNKVNEVENNTTIYGRAVLGSTGKLTVNGEAKQ